MVIGLSVNDKWQENDSGKEHSLKIESATFVNWWDVRCKTRGIKKG